MPHFLKHFFRIWCGVDPAPSPPGKVTVCQPQDQPFLRMAITGARADNQDKGANL